MKDIKAQCEATFRAVHDSGARVASDIGWVVIHCTEGDTAESAARWFTNSASEGSANLVVDDDECYRTVPDLVIPWAAPPLNKRGFHIELAGYVAWTRARWLNQGLTLQRAAYKTAHRCFTYKVPPRQVGPVGLLLGRKGVTSHNAIRLAWRKTNHTDPGPAFPWDTFMLMVQRYHAEFVANGL